MAKNAEIVDTGKCARVMTRRRTRRVGVDTRMELCEVLRVQASGRFLVRAATQPDLK